MQRAIERALGRDKDAWPAARSGAVAEADSTASEGTLQALVGALAARGERPAILAMDGSGVSTWSYARLADTVLRVAAGLMARGVIPGEPVALLGPNRPEWLVARLALLAVGALAVSLDDQANDSELGRALMDSAARRLFTTRPYVAQLERIGARQRLELYLLDDGALEVEGAASWRDLLAAKARPLPALRPDDPMRLFYTSGTTGPAKGVPLTHRNVLTVIQAIARERFLGPDDRVLVPLPYHHSYPFIVGALLPLTVGATIVLPAGVSGPEIIAALKTCGVTAILGVPRLYESLVAGIAAKMVSRGRFAAGVYRVLLSLSREVRRHLGVRVGRLLFAPLHRELAPRLRMLSCGGAKLEAEVEWTLEALGWEVLTGYGLVETASISTFNRRGRARVGSAGQSLPGVEIKIDQPDAEGHGEILIRGPNVFGGYRGDPAADRAAFTPEGWFRSGDLGYLDRDDYLYIVGRIKEVIVLPGGRKVAPETLEAAYAMSPFIREVAVLEHAGSLVALVLPDFDAVRAAGSSRIDYLIHVALADLSRELPPYQRIAGYAIVRESLPRTRLGKYQRRELRALYERARAGVPARAARELSDAERALLSQPATKAVWDWFVRRYPDRAVTLDTSPQLDLGIDSLGWVNLTLEIQERFGIRLSEHAIARVVTLGDLLREASEAGVAPAGAPARVGALDPRLMRWVEPPGLAFVLLGVLFYLGNWLFCRLAFSLRVEGRDNVPRTGQVVIVANHVSDLDPVVLAAALPPRLLLRAWWPGDVLRLFHTPVRRFMSRVCHVFPMDDRAPKIGVALGRAVLERGASQIWFPEGWRSPDGSLRSFLPGIGLLLEDYRGPVLPASIEGSFEALPRGHGWPKFRPVTVRFGPPVTLAPPAPGDGERPRRIARELEDAVRALRARRTGP